MGVWGLFCFCGWLVLLEPRQITLLVNLFIVVAWDGYNSSCGENLYFLAFYHLI